MLGSAYLNHSPDDGHWKHIQVGSSNRLELYASLRLTRACKFHLLALMPISCVQCVVSSKAL